MLRWLYKNRRSDVSQPFSVSSDAAGYISVIVVDINALYLCAIACIYGWFSYAGE